jgi:hypothetical protein
MKEEVAHIRDLLAIYGRAVTFCANQQNHGLSVCIRPGNAQLVFTAVSLDQDVMLAYSKAQLRANELSPNCRRLLQVAAEAEIDDTRDG